VTQQKEAAERDNHPVEEKVVAALVQQTEVQPAG
jgi:hypothetical protein